MGSVQDLNLEIAGLLYDLAIVHASRHGRIAYRRAAQAVLRLAEPVDELVKRHSLREVRFLGPASERVILDYLEHGRSAIVERAVEGSGRRADVEKARPFRSNFLSRAGALAALRAKLPGTVTREAYRGDLQMHSEWSDGAESIAELAAAAQERGYAWIGVSDHSYGLAIAGGMSMAEARRQRAEINRLNRREGIRVIQGIEANIPAAGGVDMTDDELATFDVVLAAPHSKLRRPEDQTERMLLTVRHPLVHVLAHPRGRMYSRQGVLADWDRVFAEAARHDVAIEIDGDPYRQDLDWTLARRARDAGCLFALDSDAHSGAQLAYADFALAHGRLAGIPSERVINTWSAEALLDWVARKSRPNGKRAILMDRPSPSIQPRPKVRRYDVSPPRSGR